MIVAKTRCRARSSSPAPQSSFRGLEQSKCGKVNFCLIGNYCRFIRGTQISCDNRSLMPGLTAVGNCETDTWSPGSEAQPIIVILGVPLSPKTLTPFMVTIMPLHVWLRGESYRKKGGFNSEFERARDRLGQRTSPSQGKCFRMFTVHLYRG